MQGHRDSPLTPRGREQILTSGMEIVKQLESPQEALIAHSDLGRAKDSANLLHSVLGAPLLAVPELREMALGPWEGLTKDVIERDWGPSRHTFWQEPHKHITLEGAESIEVVQKRTLKAILTLVQNHKGRPLVIVSHGVALGCLMAALEKRPLKDLWKDRVVNHGVTQTIGVYEKEGEVSFQRL